MQLYIRPCYFETCVYSHIDTSVRMQKWCWCYLYSTMQRVWAKRIHTLNKLLYSCMRWQNTHCVQHHRRKCFKKKLIFIQKLICATISYLFVVRNAHELRIVKIYRYFINNWQELPSTAPPGSKKFYYNLQVSAKIVDMVNDFRNATSNGSVMGLDRLMPCARMAKVVRTLLYLFAVAFVLLDIHSQNAKC